MNYVMMFVGIIILAIIPEYSSTLQFVIQGILGLSVFGIGAVNLISTENNA